MYNLEGCTPISSSQLTICYLIQHHRLDNFQLLIVLFHVYLILLILFLLKLIQLLSNSIFQLQPFSPFQLLKSFHIERQFPRNSRSYLARWYRIEVIYVRKD